MHSLIALLAQLGPEGGPGEGGGVPANQGGAPADPGGGGWGLGFFLPLLLAMVLIMLLMKPRKGDVELKKRLAELRKNDRVVTAGGIIGTVAAIREDNNTVTLRVDEASNTRIQILKTSIIKVLGSDDTPT